MALLVAVLARSGTGAFFDYDTASYLEPGRNLLLHGRFVADGAPDLLRTPGYPLFLAITSLGGIPAAVAVNVIISVFSVILVWKLGRTVFGNNRIALVAAWFFAFEPISITQSCVLLSETLFLALFLLSMEQLAEFLRRRSFRVLALAGVWLAAATLVRPITYYLPVALALGLSVVLARVPGLRWKAPAVLLLSALPLLVAWQVRNQVETGYRGLSSVEDVNAYFFLAGDVTALVEHRSFTDVRNELGYLGGVGYGEQAYLYQPYLAQHPEQVGWNQAQRLAFMHSEAVRVIRAHYGIFLRSCVSSIPSMVFRPGVGVFHHLLNPESAEYDGDLEMAVEGKPVNGVINWIRAHFWMVIEKTAFAAVLLGMYLLAVRGVFRGGMYNACLWLLLGTSLYFFAVTVVAGGPGVYSRYRLPVMPIVCILAAAGISPAKEDSAEK
jgi:hypothetical protein